MKTFNGQDSEVEDTTFYFESDHLALRGNCDYMNVLRATAILEAQRVLVLKQLEELQLEKTRYIKDPEHFLEKLQRNDIASRPRIKVAKLPQIGSYDTMPTTDIKIKTEPNNSEDYQKVRGRVVDDSKPETFNKLWTCEEQRRLEQLLMKYPAEPFESRRFVKIAKALGNRTPQQVSSRVQKYFQKLHDAGMHVPGRIPKKRRNPNTKVKGFHRPTTFFPSRIVPVYMPEDDDMSLADWNNGQRQQTSSFDWDDTGAAATSSAEDSKTDIIPTATRGRLLQLLQVIRDEKKSQLDGYISDPLATKCNACDSKPITQTRFHCNTCGYFLCLCTDCITGQLLTHKFKHITHNVVAVDKSTKTEELK